jgi:hypothetical protein
VWLVRVIRRKPGRPTPFIAHLAPWTAAVNTGLLLIFITGFMVVVFMMISKEDTRYMFGIPNNAAILMAVPLMLVPATLVMGAFSLMGWIGKYWAVWRKVYYSLVTLAAVGSVAILGYWGMVTALFR